MYLIIINNAGHCFLFKSKYFILEENEETVMQQLRYMLNIFILKIQNNNRLT
jgi:hypothetical protein